MKRVSNSEIFFSSFVRNFRIEARYSVVINFRVVLWLYLLQLIIEDYQASFQKILDPQKRLQQLEKLRQSLPTLFRNSEKPYLSEIAIT